MLGDVHLFLQFCSSLSKRHGLLCYPIITWLEPIKTSKKTPNELRSQNQPFHRYLAFTVWTGMSDPFSQFWGRNCSGPSSGSHVWCKCTLFILNCNGFSKRHGDLVAFCLKMPLALVIPNMKRMSTIFSFENVWSAVKGLQSNYSVRFVRLLLVQDWTLNT